MFRALLAALLLAACAPAADPPKLGLLVGCTEYPNHPNLRTLYGPANDVVMWRKALQDGFKFNDADIVTLAEPKKDAEGNPPKDADKVRPTAANIAAAFEALIKRAEAGSQVVILMSGHGMQVPLPKDADPLDPKNFEPDGKDEVFLPCDVEKADKDGQIKNAIKDNQVGEWLDKLRDKGAHVLIVFDCCHSGTMTRGANDPKAELREISRTADPLALGITQDQLDESAKRAAAAVAAMEAKTGKKLEAPPEVKAAGKKGGGSVAAFYAAQPFEEAPELPLPHDKPIARENYYGLLSFTLVQAIQTRQSALTYRELEQAVGAYYRGDRGARGPTPFAEGDLDREVLGMNVWPNRSAVVLDTTRKGDWSVSAGVLGGVTEGSVLAVRDKAGAKDEKTILGYVKVVDGGATLSSATVEACEYDGKPAAADKLPNLGRCEVVARDYGDGRVKIWLDGSKGVAAGYAAIAAVGPKEPVDGKKLPTYGEEVLAMMRPVKEPTEAEWLLRAVTPKQAKDDYGLTVTADHVLLVRAPGREQTEKEKEEELKRVKAGVTRRVFGAYPVGNPADAKQTAELAGLMARDLPKLFRWQTLWRVASTTDQARGGDAQLTLEIARQPSAKAKGPGEVVRGGPIAADTILDFRVENKGKDDLWVVAVYLQADLSIGVYETVGVQKGEEANLRRAQIQKKEGEYGAEGLVLLAVPQSSGKPDFKFVEQTGLTVANDRFRSKSPDSTPFVRLLEAPVVGAGSRGELAPIVDTTPRVAAGVWVAVPK